MIKKEKNGKTNINALKGAKILVFLLIFLIIIILIISLKIKIQIRNIKFDSQKHKDRHLNENYKIIISVYVLGKIKIGKIRITKEKLEKWKLKQKLNKSIKRIENKIVKDKNRFDGKLIETIKKANINLERINLKIKLGTEDAFLTSIIVPVISAIIAIIISRKIKNHENQTFEIQPLYNQQNRINILFSGIFEIKLIHIINIIYILSKKGRVNRYERTSNRRSYDYSYE